ncbi:MAG: ABC transporter ATP-binding protein [Clostridiales bacterium]|nr:ABC transporter ATP-binding protein [Clostridiales bacterium]
MSLLEVKGVKSGYGKVSVLFGIDLYVEKGEMISILGSNGAGKTTLMRTISGVTPAAEGEIRFNGDSIRNLRPDQITEKGINYVPQEKNVFPDLTVQENLDMGAFLVDDPKDRIDKVYEQFPILKERSKQYAGTLSGGERQMLAVGCALLTNPELLILDEPSGGLSPQATQALVDKIVSINEGGTSIIWVVEENPRQVLQHTKRVYMMANGQIVKTGYAQEFLDDPDFDRLFLGQSV